jgi:hypothetical protein
MPHLLLFVFGLKALNETSSVAVYFLVVSLCVASCCTSCTLSVLTSVNTTISYKIYRYRLFTLKSQEDNMFRPLMGHVIVCV